MQSQLEAVDPDCFKLPVYGRSKLLLKNICYLPLNVPSKSFGIGGACAGGVLSHDDDSESEEPCPVEEELSLHDAAAPARALAALNALRKSRQHFDVLLLAGGAEVPAHRAVLAAASPYLLEALGTAPVPSPAPAYRVDDVDADALRDLVEYAYTGRLRVPSAAHARSLYRAAWRLRLDLPRQHLAATLLKRLTPADCLDVRALPDLAPHHLADLDAYIAQNFDEVCESGALGALPLIRIEMLRESSAEGGGEAPLAVADAALMWLRERRGGEADLQELCSRTHLLYVDAAGALRDCGELPAARGDAPELQEYRREAAERGRAARRPHAPPQPLPGLELGARSARDSCAVLAARCGGTGGGGGGRATRALLAVRGALAAARVAWRDVGVGVGGAGVARGGTLGGAGAGAHVERAHMHTGRCALGAAEVNGRLVVCGGYDRARVLRSAEWYSPSSNTWTPLGDMRRGRARFPAARLGEQLYLVGGSDGHNELDSVDVLHQDRWESRARLPLALSHAAAAAHEARGELYVMGGWAAGHSLKRVHKYSPLDDKWTDAPPLNIGRSQCAGVWYKGALWALGGCDAWHCLASTERLQLEPEVEGGGPAEWQPGPALPTARRSVGAAAWRGDLVVAGGSDGGASLRRTDWLNGDTWRSGPTLRRARAGLALAVVQDTLYAVGGFDGKEFLPCVECLYQPTGEWTALCAPTGPQPPQPPHLPQLPQPPQPSHSPDKKKPEAQPVAEAVQ